jgi:hypothetical protein
VIVYISGPVTGIRDKNRRNFTRALQKIEELNIANLHLILPLKIAEIVEEQFEIFNKNRYHKTKPEWSDYMRLCIAELCTADCVYFIKDWQKSRGASLEHHIAESLGIPCVENTGELKKIFGDHNGDQRRIVDYKSLLAAR